MKTIKVDYFPSDSCFYFHMHIKEFLFIINNFTLAFTLIISGYEECSYKDTYLFNAGSILDRFYCKVIKYCMILNFSIGKHLYSQE
jgi:hypothetical protein